MKLEFRIMNLELEERENTKAGYRRQEGIADSGSRIGRIENSGFSIAANQQSKVYRENRESRIKDRGSRIENQARFSVVSVPSVAKIRRWSLVFRIS